MSSREWNGLEDADKDVISQFQETYPVPVGAIAKELGLTVKKATLSAGVSGEIRQSGGDDFIIRVNRHDVKARQRFTLAHEIAHYLLHREKIGDGIVDDLLYRSNLSDRLEAQANRLAADIIMPWGLIQNLLHKYEDLDTEKKIEKIAKDLGVSTTAIQIRLGKI